MKLKNFQRYEIFKFSKWWNLENFEVMELLNFRNNEIQKFSKLWNYKFSKLWNSRIFEI